jgi:hypothetical protein
LCVGRSYSSSMTKATAIQHNLVLLYGINMNQDILRPRLNYMDYFVLSKPSKPGS